MFQKHILYIVFILYTLFHYIMYNFINIAYLLILCCYNWGSVVEFWIYTTTQFFAFVVANAAVLSRDWNLPALPSIDWKINLPNLPPSSLNKKVPLPNLPDLPNLALPGLSKQHLNANKISQDQHSQYPTLPKLEFPSIKPSDFLKNFPSLPKLSLSGLLWWDLIMF